MQKSLSLLVPNNLDSFSCSDSDSPLVLTPLVCLGGQLRKYDRQGSIETVQWLLLQDVYSIYSESSSLSPLEATPLPDKGCSQFPSKLYLERVGSPNVRAALFAPLSTKSQARDPSRAAWLTPPSSVAFKENSEDRICPIWGLVSAAYGTLPSRSKDEFSPYLSYCPAGTNRLKDPTETQYSYRGSRWPGTPPPSFQAPPSTDDSLPASRRPQATWVGSRTHLFLGVAQDLPRVPVTAPCQTPGEI